MAEKIIKKLGKYDIVRILGKGAMGVVYEGIDPVIERKVAIKTIRSDLDASDPELTMGLARFKREAQAAGRLVHPNIVAVYEYGEDQDVSYIVMEFVEGRSLKDAFDAEERFDLKSTVEIMTSLLDALGHAHKQGVVHRDIKPANIMISKDGDVKITDFGIARIETSTMTQAGTVLGTPSYMSPEQFMGQTVDQRSDLFSTGAMLYQMLTGEKPFAGSLTTIMHKVLNEMPTRPSALNVQVIPSFDKVVEKALAKRPDDRFQSAKEFTESIKIAFENPDAFS
ncbi:MAG: serine/threonine-protein kinase, partial [Pseudomonadota bacterium]|nr:serine/threonine-protein kinase [Pseudomonadota bacterium]